MAHQKEQLVTLTSKPGLVFYPASHRYKLDGAWVPGVTTIIGVLDKSGPLSKWSAQMVAEFVADNPNEVAALYTMGHEPMVNALKAMPWQKRDDKASRGTVFHDLAERIARGESVEVPADQEGMVEAALAFMADWDIEPVLVEQVVGSREHKYAGKLDFVADNNKGPRAIFDWKSGKRIYTSAVFQTNAYGQAEFYGENGDEKPLADVGIEAAWGVHIRDDGYDVYPLKYGPDVFAEFVTVRAAFDIHKRSEGNWKIPGSGYVGAAYVGQEVA
jgi:hypothetical protein